MQENMKELNSKHGDFVLGNVTVSKAIGGARGVPCLVWETSLLDELKGISFRGLSIPEIQKKMPTVVPGGEPTPEGMLWLLLTGEIPTKKEMESVQEELHGRSQLPSGVKRVINSLRKDMHPMTQLSIAVMAMQADSKFAKAYQVCFGGGFRPRCRVVRVRGQFGSHHFPARHEEGGLLEVHL